MSENSGQLIQSRSRKSADRFSSNLWHVIVMLLLVQLLTGLLLLTAYAPAATTAWGSVWYIQVEQSFGWLIRGLHVVATDALIVMAGLYLAVMFVRGPWNVSIKWHWWMGLGTLAFILAFALTGYLLPYDQRAYWGTVVRTNILANTPYLGGILKRLLLADDAPGTLALTRFHALHVALLPILAAFFWNLVRRFLLLPIESSPRPDVAAKQIASAPALPCDVAIPQKSTSYVEQARCMSSTLERALIRLATVLALVCWVVVRHHHLGRTDLDAPADATEFEYPARPEWWALPLFQWLKYFQTPVGETFAAIVLPGVLMGALMLLPLVPRKFATPSFHRWTLRAAALGMILALALMGQALWNDYRPGASYHNSRGIADRQSARAISLAQEKGIPPDGAHTLLLADPLTRGPKLFATHCAHCHRIYGHDGIGNVPAEPPTSSDLGGFATRGWIRGLLYDPMHANYFGRMKNAEGEPAHTKMQEWLAELNESNADPDARAQLGRDFDSVAAYLADEAVRPGRLATWNVAAVDSTETDLLHRGRRVFVQSCNECHSYQGERSGTFSAPEMHGYGSPEWLELMISSPDHELRYRSKGRQRAQMPPFRERLAPSEIRLIAEWLFLARDEKALIANSSKPN